MQSIEKSDYAKREERKRYLVFLANGKLHDVCRDLSQAEHVVRLYPGSTTIAVRTDNQEDR